MTLWLLIWVLNGKAMPPQSFTSERECQSALASLKRNLTGPWGILRGACVERTDGGSKP